MSTTASFDEEIELLEDQLEKLYVKRNRQRGIGPVVVPEEKTFTIAEDFFRKSRPVTITSVSEDGKTYTGTTTPYTEMATSNQIEFNVDPETREAPVVHWSHVTLTWDECKRSYFCDSYMCKDRHRLVIDRPESCDSDNDDSDDADDEME